MPSLIPLGALGGGGGASPTLANIPPGSVVVVYWNGTNWRYNGTNISARPTSRTDVTINFIDPIGTATEPAFGIEGDIFDQVVV